MTVTLELLALLVGFASLLGGGFFGFIKFILPMVQTLARIEANQKNEKEDIEKQGDRITCLESKYENHETRLDELERKVL